MIIGKSKIFLPPPSFPSLLYLTFWFTVCCHPYLPIWKNLYLWTIQNDREGVAYKRSHMFQRYREGKLRERVEIKITSDFQFRKKWRLLYLVHCSLCSLFHSIKKKRPSWVSEWTYIRDLDQLILVNATTTIFWHFWTDPPTHTPPTPLPYQILLSLPSVASCAGVLLGMAFRTSFLNVLIKKIKDKK